MSFLLYTAFILFSFGQLGRISLLNQQINFYLYELAMAILLIIGFIKYGFQPVQISIKKISLVYVFLGYLLITFLFNVVNYSLQENLVAFLYWIRLLFYWLYFVYIFRIPKSSFKLPIALFLLLTTVISITQYLFYPDLRNLIYLGWDPHYNRLFGVFFDTSIAGAVYGIIFLYLLMNKTKLIAIAIYLVFVILTYSRSLYIVLLITAFWYFISRRQFKIMIATILFFITVLMFVPTNFGTGVGLNRVFSVNSRISDYKEALTVWSRSPVTGIGYNRINRSETIHARASYSSSYLNILVTSGLAGLGIFLALLYRLGKFSRQAGFYVLFIALLSFADNILLHPYVMYLFGLVLLVSDRHRL